MIAYLKRNKRGIRIFSFIFLLILIGFGFLDMDFESSGLMALRSAIFVVVYILFTRGLERFKLIKLDATRWNQEVWGAILLLGVLCVFGGVEAYFHFPEFLLLFCILFLFTLFFGYLHFKNGKTNGNEIEKDKRKISLGLAFWGFVIGFGAVLLVLEEAGNDDALIVLGFCYFSFISFIALRWTFLQIRSLANLKNEQTKSELLHLKSQVNPHFFFNMLNNLYGLVEKNPKKARTLILKLSDMMRYSIYEGQKEEVSLIEEVDYLKNFIELHEMRYHKEIDLKFSSNIQKESLKIMPLLFIILLENAFKHGVEKLIEKPYVHVEIIGKENEVYFMVENNFDAIEEKKKNGIGLKNLKRRLELVYQNNHVLSFLQNESTFKAELSIKNL